MYSLPFSGVSLVAVDGRDLESHWKRNKVAIRPLFWHALGKFPFPTNCLKSPFLVTPEPERPTSEAEETLIHDTSCDADLLDLEVGSMSMDEFLLCFHGSPPPAPSLARGDPPRLPLTRGKNANGVWKEAPSGGGLGYEGAAACGEVTLEDFLAKNGAITEVDVVAPLEEQEKAGVSVDPAISGRLCQQEQHVVLDSAALGFRNGEVGGGGRRARKRSALDNLVDKADLRRQKRMIKNRESAARSRERKQAYTVELESLVSRLEEENAILLSEQEEQYEMRIHQLMENIIPITEKRKPPHILRKIHSMLW